MEPPGRPDGAPRRRPNAAAGNGQRAPTCRSARGRRGGRAPRRRSAPDWRELERRRVLASVRHPKVRHPESARRSAFAIARSARPVATATTRSRGARDRGPSFGDTTRTARRLRYTHCRFRPGRCIQRASPRAMHMRTGSRSAEVAYASHPGARRARSAGVQSASSFQLEPFERMRIGAIDAGATRRTRERARRAAR